MGVILLHLAKFGVLAKWLFIGLAQNVAVGLTGLDDRIIGWARGYG